MRVILACLAVVVVIVTLALAPDPRSSPPDPRTGFVNAQPQLIAEIIGSERRFVTETDRSLNSVWLLDGLDVVAHVRGYYRTALSRPGDRQLNYQMVVVRDRERDVYTATCFVLRDEMADGKPGCF